MVDERTLGSCWRRVNASGRCSEIYAENVTRGQCCAVSGWGMPLMGWTPHPVLTPKQFFFWVVLTQGAPNCQACPGGY